MMYNLLNALHFSTFLDAETRRQMGEQAVALAKNVEYSSAGNGHTSTLCGNSAVICATTMIALNLSHRNLATK